MSLVRSIADGIEVVEGFWPGSRAWRNNNPGNIWDGMPNRIWPGLPVDSEGFVIFPSYEAGRAELERQVSIKINRGLTLRQLLSEWAPGSDPRNNPSIYTASVAAMTGLNPDVPLFSLGGVWDVPAAAGVGVNPVTGVSTLPALTWPETWPGASSPGGAIAAGPGGGFSVPEWAPWAVAALGLWLVVT